MKLNRTGILIIVMVMFLMSCTTPPEDVELEADLLLTNVALTVDAELALMAELETELPPTPTPTLEPTSTSIPTATPRMEPPEPTSVAYVQPLVSTSTCDMAAFVADITVPDGTHYAADTEFTKTWSLQNIGTCTWTSDYEVYFYSGIQMSGPSSQALTLSDVAPGSTVEISIAMAAPSEAGQYVGYWALQNASGEHFGIGSSSDAFYVDITVTTSSATATATLTPTATSLYTSTATAPATETVEVTSTNSLEPTETSLPESTSTDVPELTATPTPTS